MAPMSVADTQDRARPWWSAAWVRWSAGGLLVLAVILVAFGVAIRVLTSEGTDADPDTGGVVALNRLRIPVERLLPGYEAVEARVWKASPAPSPEFDTSGLGPDRSFTWGEPPASAFGGLEGDVVYLGDQGGRPMIIHATAAAERNPWDHIYAWVTGHGDRRVLDATFPCCHFSYDQVGTIHPGLNWRAGGGALVQWLGTPGGTSVVALEVNGEPFGFQRPTGGIITMEVEDEPPLVLALTTFDPSGAVIDVRELRIEPIPDL